MSGRASIAVRWCRTTVAVAALTAWMMWGVAAHAQPQPIKPHTGDVALRWSILPGGGQVYNHQAWKVPIIYGTFAGMGYLIYDNYRSMKMFKDEYLYRVSHNDTPSLESYASYPTSNIYNLYNNYNRNFQLMIIITVGIYALNLIDAYVFGHLFDFQIDDNLSMAFQPALQPTVGGLLPTFGLGIQF